MTLSTSRAIAAAVKGPMVAKLVKVPGVVHEQTRRSHSGTSGSACVRG